MLHAKGGLQFRDNLHFKSISSSVDIGMVSYFAQSDTRPTRFGSIFPNFITTKLNMKILSPKMVMAPIISKIYVILSKCDNVIENIQIHTSWSIFFVLVWNFAQLWKIIMKREHLITFFFLRKKLLDLQKIKNHVVTFSYLFQFGNKLFNV